MVIFMKYHVSPRYTVKEVELKRCKSVIKETEVSPKWVVGSYVKEWCLQCLKVLMTT